MLQIFNMFAPKMIETALGYLRLENDEKSHSILKHVQKAAAMFSTGLFGEELLESWKEALSLALYVCKKKKQEVIEDLGNPNDMDEEELEDFEAEFAIPNNLMHVVMDTTSQWMKLFGEKIESVVINTFGGYFYEKLVNYTVEDEIHYSVCFYAELFLYCSEDTLLKGYSVVLDNSFPALEKTEDVNFQQTGAFLVGVIGKRLAREKFASYSQRSFGLLQKLADEEDSRSEDKKIRTETVMGAFGKLCIYQNDNSDQKCQILLASFLNYLPMQTDPEEAQIMNGMFIEEVGKGNQNILINDDFKQKSKEILISMSTIMKNNPELEILDDKGQQALELLLA